MRSTFLIILLSILFMFLVGCGSVEESSTDSNNNSTNTDKVEEKDNNGGGNNPLTEVVIDSYETLSCSGPYVINSGIMYVKGSDGSFDYTFDLLDGEVGIGEYTFKFDSNGLVNIKSIETLSKEASEIENDENLDEEVKNISKNCEAEVKSGIITMTCNLDKDDNMVKAFSDDNKTTEELKNMLEEHTPLVCK